MSSDRGARALEGQVAIVTGATRGLGKGCALELGAAGATVYVTGRTLEPGQADARAGCEALQDVELRLQRRVARKKLSDWRARL